MKILLIDDNANYGWKQLIAKVFPYQGISIDPALDYDSALSNLKIKYDIIFLDVRLTAEDHINHKVEEFTGYKILKKIRKEFTAINFSTPIILLTASNKIWNIDAFRNYGVDAYYIKEHPNYIFDKETSKQNYKNLKENFKGLLEVGSRRNRIWDLSAAIISKLEGHKYFKNGSGNDNIKDRIEDKLKLGYATLFKSQTSIEKEILLEDNQALTFIIFFSVFEEISKAYSKNSNWDNNYNFTGNWEFKNGKKFISKKDGTIFVNPVRESGNYIEKEYSPESKIPEKYIDGKINLSEQIYAIIYNYEISNSQYKFKKLNDFRNKIDYIHSSLQAIYNSNLNDNCHNDDKFNMTVKTLELIIEILKRPNRI
jgi:CheY-like chemotaxis protein